MATYWMLNKIANGTYIVINDSNHIPIEGNDPQILWDTYSKDNYAMKDIKLVKLQDVSRTDIVSDPI